MPRPARTVSRSFGDSLRRSFHIGAITLCLTGAAAAADTTNADDALVEKLETTKVTVEYAPEDLVKVIDALRSQQGLNVQVAWSVLDASGVRKDKRVEIRLKDVSLTVLLDNLVRELDPNGAIGLGWGVESGVVVITEQQALGKQAILKAYDVRDLLESGYAVRRFAVTPTLTLETTGREWVGGDEKKESGGGGGGFGSGGGGGGAPFGSPREDPTNMEKTQRLADLIMGQVAPESWQDQGGAVGSLNERDGVLYVRQTIQNHQQIRAMLELVRSTQPAPLHVDVAIVRLSPQRSAALRAKSGDQFPVIGGDVANELAFGANVEGVLFRSTIGGRNGEAAWISDVTQNDVVVGQHAVVAQQASEKTPILGRIHSGLEVIALPQVNLATKTTALDVQMAWKPSIGIDRASEFTSIDRTEQRMRTVASQLRCKLGDAVALTIPAGPGEGGASLENDDWLIVRVRGANG